MIWKSIVMFYYSLKDVKRRFNLSHVTRVSAQSMQEVVKSLFSWESFIWISGFY